MIDRPVPRDRQHPGLERRGTPEPSQFGPRNHKGVLCHVLRVLPDSQRSERCSIDRRLMANHELVECGRVTLLRQQDQLLVRHTTYRHRAQR